MAYNGLVMVHRATLRSRLQQGLNIPAGDGLADPARGADENARRRVRPLHDRGALSSLVPSVLYDVADLQRIRSTVD